MKSCWEHLKQTKKNIYIYGMGDGCEKILDFMKSQNIQTSGIFASDEFARNTEFHGYTVGKLSDIQDNNICIVTAFGAGYKELQQKIENLAEKYELYCPDMEVVGNRAFTMDFVNANLNLFKQAYNLLADDYSKKTFEAVLKFKLSGNINDIKPIFCDEQEIYKNLIKPCNGKNIVDLGAYNGDTILKYIKLSGCENLSDFTGNIYAFEPDRKNFRKLLKNTADIKNINYYNAVVYSHQTRINFDGGSGRGSQISNNGKSRWANSVDNAVQNNKIDFIKFDVEGGEYNALLGCKQIIKNSCPTLLVSAYHKIDDLFKLPILINKLNKDYKIYLRQPPHYPAWETCFIAK